MKSNGYQIDYLSFTLPSGHLPRAFKILEKFNLESLPKGLYGYLFSYEAVGCKLLYSPDRQDVHVQLTGRGCDAFDCLSLPEDARVTRLDIAFDSYDGAYTPSDIWGCIQQRKYAGKSRTITGYMGLAGKDEGCTLYIGSKASDARLRIYDKAAEQGIAKDKRIDFSDWTRYELQLRNGIAQASYNQIVQHSGLPAIAPMSALSMTFIPILETMFMICDEEQISRSDVKNHHYTRTPSAAWSKMFKSFNHKRPKVTRKSPTLNNLSKYVMGAAASFKALSLVFDGFDTMFRDKVADVDYSERHQELLLDFAPVYLATEQEHLSYYDFPF